MKKTVAVIPIKLHNQRLPGKNIRPLGDKVLCQYLFNTVNCVKNIDEVYVFCSDESICQYIPNGINFLKRSITEVVKKVRDENYDSAFAARQIKEFVWYNGMPINYSLTNVVRTQELQPVYIEGELFAFEKKVFTEEGRRIGNKPWIQSVGWKESICIDDIEDFEMAEAVIELEKRMNIER